MGMEAAGERVPRPALRSTHPFTQRMSWVLSLGFKRPGRYTDSSHLVKRLRMHVFMPSLLQGFDVESLMKCRDKFIFILLKQCGTVERGSVTCILVGFGIERHEMLQLHSRLKGSALLICIGPQTITLILTDGNETCGNCVQIIFV
jgi:hypothetical protein